MALKLGTRVKAYFTMFAAAIAFLAVILLAVYANSIKDEHDRKQRVANTLASEAISLYCYHHFGEDSESVKIRMGDIPFGSLYAACFIPHEGATYFVVAAPKCVYTWEYDDCIALTGAADEF